MLLIIRFLGTCHSTNNPVDCELYNKATAVAFWDLGGEPYEELRALLDVSFFEIAKNYERYFELEERASSFDLEDALELEVRMHEIKAR